MPVETPTSNFSKKSLKVILDFCIVIIKRKSITKFSFPCLFIFFFSSFQICKCVSGMIIIIIHVLNFLNST